MEALVNLVNLGVYYTMIKCVATLLDDDEDDGTSNGEIVSMDI